MTDISEPNRPTSTPPEAKVLAARTAYVIAAIGAANDIVCTLLLGTLIAIGRMDPEPWGYVMAGMGAGATYARMKGRAGAGTTALLVGSVAGKGVAATLLKKTLIGLAIVGLSGCAGTIPPAPVLKAPPDAEQVRAGLAEAHGQIAQARSLAAAYCPLVPEQLGIAVTACRTVDWLGPVYERLAPVVDAAVETYALAGVSEKQARDLLTGLQELAFTLQALSSSAQEVVNAAKAAAASAEPSGGSGSVADRETRSEPPAEAEGAAGPSGTPSALAGEDAAAP